MYLTTKKAFSKKKKSDRKLSAKEKEKKYVTWTYILRPGALMQQVGGGVSMQHTKGHWHGKHSVGTKT
jgi:hypothetical protein